MARRDYDDEDDGPRGRSRGRGRDDDDDRDRGGGRSRSRSRDDDDDDDRGGRGRSRGGGRDRDDDKSGKSIEIKLPNVRLSYEHIFKAARFSSNGRDRDDDESKPAYSASFIIDPRKQQDLIDDCWAAIDEAMESKWGRKLPKIKDDKYALRNDKDSDEYDGMWYVAARSNKRPGVIDRDKTPLNADDGVVYSGCYVNAIVRFWCQDNKWGKRVNASLEAVQFVKDGEAFGAAPVDTDKAFDNIDDDGGDDRDRGRGGRSRSRDRDRDDDDRGSRRGRSADRGRDRDDDDDEDRTRRSRRARREEDDGDDDRNTRRAESRRNRRDADDDDPPPRRRSERDDDRDDNRRGSRRGRDRDLV